jgi:hypothetical protein
MRYPLYLLMPALLLAAHAEADSMRCGNALVSQGDSRSEVRAKCGEPTDVETRTVVRRDGYEFNGRRYDYNQDTFVEIPIEHPLFHCCYDIKTKPQVPSIHMWATGRLDGGVENPAHFRGLSDETGRLMVVACHNTDLGDGWERINEDRKYFLDISQRLAFPIGVNIVVYAMSDRSSDKPPQAKPVEK